jgi:predicted HAD superfamily Cof-like phosphohydrolase
LCNEATAKLRYDLIDEELQELKQAQKREDIIWIADAIGDLLYVVYGCAVAYGIPAQQVFDEVHRSNMSKFIDGHRREDGKWIKGPSYSPPDLRKVLGL